jgi:hypothetical protein
MKSKKGILLFLALLLPGLIFVMLKLFGRNQFDVQPLYQSARPESTGNCGNIAIPYYIPDSVLTVLPIENDSLVCIHFNSDSGEANAQLQRAVDAFAADPVNITSSNPLTHKSWKECIFFLREPFDVVLVDRRGTIRGQYIASDRDEMDRMITEITILLKKY